MKKLLSVFLMLILLSSLALAPVGGMAEDQAEVRGVSMHSREVPLGGKAGFWVITNNAARYLAAFDKEGNRLMTWTAIPYSTPTRDKLDWYGQIAFDTPGVYDITFKASSDGENWPEKGYSWERITVRDTPFAPISTGVPQIESYEESDTGNVVVNGRIWHVIMTPDNAKTLAFFDSNGEIIRTWDAEDCTSATYDSDKIKWIVMTHAPDKSRFKGSFAASEDGVTYGDKFEVSYWPLPLDLTPYSQYLGTWYVQEVILDGQAYSAVFLGMDAAMTLMEGGAAQIEDVDGNYDSTWTIIDEELSVEGMQGALREDGTILAEGDGMQAVIGREKPVFEGISAEEVASRAEYLGEWFCAVMTDGGETIDLMEWGLSVTLTVHDDGTCVLDMMGDAENLLWMPVENGINMMGVLAVIQEDGMLMVEESGTQMMFSREPIKAPEPEPTKAPEPEKTQAPEPTGPNNAALSAYADYIGTWYACYLNMGGMTGDMRAVMPVKLILNADGTAVFDMMGPENGTWYADEKGILFFKGMNAPIALSLKDGFLQFGGEMSGFIMFSKDKSAVWSPNAAPSSPSAPSPTPPLPAGSVQDVQLDVKYTCTSADVAGNTLPASMLGAEYAVTFFSNGTTELVMAGVPVQGLAWRQNDVSGQAAISITYFDGNDMHFILTDKGFDMDYYGAMLLHFEPVQ